MSETIFIGVAWPYANGPIHQGQFAGAYLPPDILARYHRTRGNRVLMVSGSDVHGTPITVRAEREGRTPAEVANEFHRSFLHTWERMGISFDLFTTTGTPNHEAVTQDVFLRLLEQGYIYTATQELPYCETDRRFLLDRYVEGTCPNCGYSPARGDQCDNCGRPLDPTQLIDWRCKFCGNPPVIRESEHFFLKLSAFQDRLRAWLDDGVKATYWRKNVLNFSLGMLNEGLHDNAITRDIDWGIPIPVAGWESKRIYVWFEAVIGYLSAAKEWAQLQGTPDAWQDFWQNPETKGYLFIGKDNIWFHAIIWPAMLMGYGDLDLPYDIPANQYVNLGGRKSSTSQNWAVWLPDYLTRYDPDPLRYYLSAAMPETSDTDFTWGEFLRRNNDELVATWGNLVNRVLTQLPRNFEGRVPEPVALDERATALIDRARSALETVGNEIAACHFRAGIGAAMALAQEANRHLDETAPWKSIRDDRQSAANSLYTSIAVIAALRTAFYPYLPHTCEQLNRYLGETACVQDLGWKLVIPNAGRALPAPSPLFKKLDPSIVEAEEGRLGT
ncbi:MAG: methionine--tRNA ligase [Dehalococcoidia bacterium]